jgi:hypothetical protein
VGQKQRQSMHITQNHSKTVMIKRIAQLSLAIHGNAADRTQAGPLVKLDWRTITNAQVIVQFGGQDTQGSPQGIRR